MNWYVLKGTGVEPPGALYVLPLQAGAGSGISYLLEKEGSVSLQVFDAAGRLVRTLVNEHRPAGDHNVVWDRRTDGGRHVSAGVYFIKLKLDDMADTKKMMIVQ